MEICENEWMMANHSCLDVDCISIIGIEVAEVKYRWWVN